MDVRSLAFKIHEPEAEVFIFGFKLVKSLSESHLHLLSLLSGDSGALSVLDEAVLGLGEDAAHLDEALYGHNVEVDLEEADPEGVGVDGLDVPCILASGVT